MQEMPLVVFTLAEQVSVGALVSLVVLFLMGKVSNASTLFKTFMVIAVVALLGMLASLAHLGQPLRCINAVMNVGTSWLSREIIFFAAFVVFAFVCSISAKMEKIAVLKALSVIALVCGILALISTCMCYMMPGVPAWDSPATPLQFILVAAVCGFSFAQALVASFEKTSKLATWWIVFAVVLVIAVVSRYMFFADIVLLIDLV